MDRIRSKGFGDIRFSHHPILPIVDTSQESQGSDEESRLVDRPMFLGGIQRTPALHHDVNLKKALTVVEDSYRLVIDN